WIQPYSFAPSVFSGSVVAVAVGVADGEPVGFALSVGSGSSEGFGVVVGSGVGDGVGVGSCDGDGFGVGVGSGSFTITFTVAFCPLYVTVITASPLPTALTSPPLTVATFSLLLDQVASGVTN